MKKCRKIKTNKYTTPELAKYLVYKYGNINDAIDYCKFKGNDEFDKVGIYLTKIKSLTTN